MQQPIKSLPPPIHFPKPYPPRLRIADILLISSDGDGDGDDDDEDEEEVAESEIGAMNGFWRQHQQTDASCGLECASPRRIVSRLFRKLKERGKPLHWKDGDEKEPVEERSPSLTSSVVDAGTITDNGDGGSSVGTARSDESGLFGRDTRFNMGVACNLMYLIASSNNELTKMKELRTDMEMLLQNVKEEIGRKDYVSETSMSKESTAASCFTDLKEDSRCGSLLSGRSMAAPYVLPGEETITISSRSILCDESRKESVDGMERLEAELEAELERLQLQLEIESSTQSKKITASDTAGGRSNSFSLGEVVDPDEAMTGIHCGVPPIELERRLHELLQSRQQERIKELEAAMEGLKQKLSEKEREATWWKNTALFMSRHVPEPPGRS